MERLCLECNSTLTGRTDKKFCNDSCRSQFNNCANTEDHFFIGKVNQILRRNRKILKSLSIGEKTLLKPGILDNMGFNFNYCTQAQSKARGKIWFFCYEYGYIQRSDNKIMLIRKKTETS